MDISDLLDKWMNCQEDLNKNEQIIEELDYEMPMAYQDIIKETYSPKTSDEKDAIFQATQYPHKTPIFQMDSVGKDQKNKVTPNYTDGDDLVALANLKDSIEKLERIFVATEAMGENSDSIGKKLKELREKFEDLSNLIQPDPSKENS